MKIGVIDIGTNTVLFVAAESIRENAFRILKDAHAIARLGEGVDDSRLIREDAYRRLSDTLASHLIAAKKLKSDHIIAVGTSALRDATNRDEIIKRVEEVHDLSIKLLSGEQEAELTYLGATIDMSKEEKITIGVLDIGGGSTELSFKGTTGQATGKSLDIGAVRITERFLPGDPPTRASITRAKEFIHSQVDRLRNLEKVDKLVAVAGTPTTLSAMTLGLTEFSPDAVNGSLLSLSGIKIYIEELASLPIGEVLQKYPVINKARADILLGGSLILESVMDTLGLSEVQVSVRGLRYGVLLAELERLTGVEAARWRLVE